MELLLRQALAKAFYAANRVTDATLLAALLRIRVTRGAYVGIIKPLALDRDDSDSLNAVIAVTTIGTVTLTTASTAKRSKDEICMTKLSILLPQHCAVAWGIRRGEMSNGLSQSPVVERRSPAWVTRRVNARQ
jgi:hypothetical protein